MGGNIALGLSRGGASEEKVSWEAVGEGAPENRLWQLVLPPIDASPAKVEEVEPMPMGKKKRRWLSTASAVLQKKSMMMMKSRHLLVGVAKGERRTTATA